MSDHELLKLRRALGKVERGSGKRYPRPLRDRLVTWTQKRLREGNSLSAITYALGVRSATLKKWTTPRTRDVDALVPVEVVAEPPAQRGVSVTSPAGFRVDGLTLDEAATLLRVL